MSPNRKLPLWSAAGVLFLMLAGCCAKPVPIESEILDTGSASGFERPGEHYEVIESQSGLDDLYRTIYAGRLPAPQAPKIDFSKSLVLFVGMEQQPSAGYRVELGDPALLKGSLLVPVYFHSPPEENFQAAVLTRPFALMRVARPVDLTVVEFRRPDGSLEAKVPVE